MKQIVLIVIATIFIIGPVFGMTNRPLNKAKKRVINENIEWTGTWVVGTNKYDLPKILVIGDSHVNAYYPVLAELLKNKVYASKFTTSKCFGDPVYIYQLEWFLKSYKFNVICFNNGLHGATLPLKQYTKGLKEVYKLLKKYQPTAKLIWVNTTARRIANRTSELDSLNQQVIDRNSAVENFVREKKIPIVDSYTLSIDHPEFFKSDGIHFEKDGVNKEAKGVEKQILEAIDQPK